MREHNLPQHYKHMNKVKVVNENVATKCELTINLALAQNGSNTILKLRAHFLIRN